MVVRHGFSEHPRGRIAPIFWRSEARLGLCSERDCPRSLRSRRLKSPAHVINQTAGRSRSQRAWNSKRPIAQVSSRARRREANACDRCAHGASTESRSSLARDRCDLFGGALAPFVGPPLIKNFHPGAIEDGAETSRPYRKGETPLACRIGRLERHSPVARSARAFA